MKSNKGLPANVMNNILLSTALNNKTLPKEVNPFDGINPNIELMFEPIAEWTSCGNNHKRSKTMYKNVEIIHDVVYSWNILKRPSDNFSVGLIIPIDTVLSNDGKVVEYYCPDGFGCPDFKTLKDALEFIDNNPELANNEVMLN